MNEVRKGTQKSAAGTKRAALLLAATAGCYSSGPGDFRHVCPDAGTATLIDGGGLQIRIAEGSDPACVAPFPLFVGLGPPGEAVAVGAPFRLEYDLMQSGDASVASAPPLPVRPAVASFVASTSQGWVLPRASYVSFLAWQGSKAADHEDVLARDFVSIRLLTVGLGCGSPPLLLQPLDASADGCRTSVGVPAIVVAVMADDEGGALGGSVECTFASSDPAVLPVTARGIVAHATPAAAGDASLAVDCMGRKTSLLVHVSPAVLDASTEGG